MMATLEHPNVVRIYNFGEVDQKPYLVMQSVQGEDLSSFIRKQEKSTEQEALGILQQIIQALDAAWQKRVIHRDIKPSNILID